jgi:hypothetical protein
MEIKVFSKNKRFLSLMETATGKFIKCVKGYFVEAREVRRDFFIHYDKSSNVWAVHDYLTARRIAAASEYFAALEAFSKTIKTFNLDSLKNLPAINPD